MWLERHLCKDAGRENRVFPNQSTFYDPGRSGAERIDAGQKGVREREMDE